jgi:hypothetical protein
MTLTEETIGGALHTSALPEKIQSTVQELVRLSAEVQMLNISGTYECATAINRMDVMIDHVDIAFSNDMYLRADRSQILQAMLLPTVRAWESIFNKIGQNEQNEQVLQEMSRKAASGVFRQLCVLREISIYVSEWDSVFDGSPLMKAAFERTGNCPQR